LRKIYIDPITGDSNWGFGHRACRRNIRVYSLSEDEPIRRQLQFCRLELRGKMKYAEWYSWAFRIGMSSPCEAALEEGRKQP